MRTISTIYIDGAFVEPHGSEVFDLINPSTSQVIGHVTLGDREDALAAIAAAKRAFPAFSRTTKAERIDMLRRLDAAVTPRLDALNAATIEEYGAPAMIAGVLNGYAMGAFKNAIEVLEAYDFSRWINDAEVVMEPVGIVGIITPWNSNVGFICGKLAMAIAAGCTSVIKPSEMSAIQTQVLLEALHEAGHHRQRHSGREIGVVQDHGRRLAAKLQGHPLQSVGPGPHDSLSNRGRAGERDLGDVRVGAQLRAHHVAAAVDDVEHAGRRAGLGQ